MNSSLDTESGTSIQAKPSTSGQNEIVMTRVPPPKGLEIIWDLFTLFNYVIFATFAWYTVYYGLLGIGGVHYSFLVALLEMGVSFVGISAATAIRRARTTGTMELIMAEMTCVRMKYNGLAMIVVTIIYCYDDSFYEILDTLNFEAFLNVGAATIGIMSWKFTERWIALQKTPLTVPIQMSQPVELDSTQESITQPDAVELK